MSLRRIENKSELSSLIFTTLCDIGKEFSLTELIEKVLKSTSFNNFCSREVLKIEVENVVDVAIDNGVIAHYPYFFTSKTPKYIVIT